MTSIFLQPRKSQNVSKFWGLCFHKSRYILQVYLPNCTERVDILLYVINHLEINCRNQINKRQCLNKVHF